MLDSKYGASGTVDVSIAKDMFSVAYDPQWTLTYIDGLVMLVLFYSLVISALIVFSEVRLRRLARSTEND